jgi:hypothetical protein
MRGIRDPLLYVSYKEIAISGALTALGTMAHAEVPAVKSR